MLWGVYHFLIIFNFQNLIKKIWKLIYRKNLFVYVNNIFKCILNNGKKITKYVYLSFTIFLRKRIFEKGLNVFYGTKCRGFRAYLSWKKRFNVSFENIITIYKKKRSNSRYIKLLWGVLGLTRYYSKFIIIHPLQAHSHISRKKVSTYIMLHLLH